MAGASLSSSSSSVFCSRTSFVAATLVGLLATLVVTLATVGMLPADVLDVTFGSFIIPSSASAPTPRPRLASHNYCGKGKVVALTYDDGPCADKTPQILDVLSRKGAVATFFITPNEQNRHDVPGGNTKGTQEDKCAIVRRILEQGSAVESHSYNHPWLELTDPAHLDLIKREQELTEDWVRQCLKLAKNAPSPVREFRPMYGNLDHAFATFLSKLGYVIGSWNVDTDDWKGGEIPAMLEAWEAARDEVREGRSHVVLMHDFAFPGPAYLEAIIDWYAGEGYEFVTMHECYRRCVWQGSCKYKGVFPGVFDAVGPEYGVEEGDYE